jgi:predicted permease
MTDVLSLALPFFGLIVLGFASGRFVQLPESGLAWLNYFIIYIALPPLFFQLVSRTPFEQLANGRFILVTTLSTAVTFYLAIGVGLWLRRGNLPEATIAGIVGGYANVG